eukprot:c18665_g1_i7.p2 GENE.c18665_g1_i7~~c18665_g1_i7.p2  ORF type:complete len:105 (+),score=22.36 c18665_g1_i7:301-615(+)
MKKTGVVVAVDILDMEPIPGVVVIHSDIFAQPTFQAIVDATQGKYADVVMSDMAPNVSGDMERDHCEQMVAVQFVQIYACCVFNLVVGELRHLFELPLQLRSKS